MSAIIIGDISSFSIQLQKNLLEFADFIEADSVRYDDKGNYEELTIHKNSKDFKIRACGNKFDGGFFGYN